MDTKMKYRVENNRVVNDKGEVAVIYSPGYGAGWYTWNRDFKDCVFDPDCVFDLIHNHGENIVTIAEKKWPDGYWNGGLNAKLFWFPVGTKFVIEEYDGYESVRFYQDLDIIIV